MNFYWIKTSYLIKKLFGRFIWDFPNQKRKIFLTFDDGPTPKVTEWVLDELEKFNAKASFFCIGKNIENHPEIFSKIISKGHTIGNHTYKHLNGWKTKSNEYLTDIKLCDDLIDQQLSKKSKSHPKIFRPPYGKIKFSQAKKLRSLGYKIIMWEVLSGDFDSNISTKECIENVINNVQSGSIVVFHDSIKAFHHLEITLPKVLKYLDEKGFVFEKIN